MATSAKVTRASRGIDGVPGSRREVFRDVTFSSSYSTGGEAAPSLASMGLKDVVFVEVETGGARNSAGTSFVPVSYSRSGHKVQAYRYDGSSAAKAYLEEVSAGTNLSTFTARLKFVGTPAS